MPCTHSVLTRLMRQVAVSSGTTWTLKEGFCEDEADKSLPSPSLLPAAAEDRRA